MDRSERPLAQEINHYSPRVYHKLVELNKLHKDINAWVYNKPGRSAMLRIARSLRISINNNLIDLSSHVDSFYDKISSKSQYLKFKLKSQGFNRIHIFD